MNEYPPLQDATDADEARRERMCTGKKRYADKKEARTVFNLAMRRRGRHGRAEQLHIYPCPFCAGYHLSKGAAR